MHIPNNVFLAIIGGWVVVMVLLHLPSRKQVPAQPARVTTWYLRAVLMGLVLFWAAGLGLGLYGAGVSWNTAVTPFLCGLALPVLLLQLLVDLEGFRARALDNRLGRMWHRRVAGLDPRQLLRVQSLGHCMTCDNAYVIPWFAQRWLRTCPNCSNRLTRLSMAEVTTMRREASSYGILNEQFDELLEERRAFEPEDDIKAGPGRH